MRRNTIITILVAVLFVAVAAAVGFGAFRAGQAYGISQSPAIATAIANQSESGTTGMPYMMGGPFGWGTGMGRPFGGGFGPFGMHFGPGFGPGFGIFQCLVPLFFLLLIFAIFRLVFRPWGWRGGWGRGPWGHHDGPDGQHAVPPMFEEWHKRAHGQTPPPPPTDVPPTANA